MSILAQDLLFVCDLGKGSFCPADLMAADTNSDLMSQGDIEKFLNEDQDLVEIESDNVEGPCPADIYTLSFVDKHSTAGTEGRSSFLLTTEAPVRASSRDIKWFGSLATVTSCEMLSNQLFKETPAGKDIATIALSIGTFLNPITWTRLKLGRKGAIPDYAQPVVEELRKSGYGYGERAAASKRVQQLFDGEKMKAGAALLSAIGALGYSRTHSLGALSGKPSEQVGTSGSATVRSRSESVAVDVFVM